MEMKYFRPTSQNKEDHGYVWHANLELGHELWVQIGRDKESPEWKRLGEMYEHAYIHAPFSQHVMIQALLLGLRCDKTIDEIVKDQHAEQ